MVLKLFLLLACIYISEGLNDYKYYKYYDIKGGSAGLKKLVEVTKGQDEYMTLISKSKNSVQLVVAPQQSRFIQEVAFKENLNVHLLYDDVSEIIRQEKGDQSLRKKKRGFSWNQYYDVDEIYSYLSNVSRSYPTWTQQIVGGKSYEGRQIRGLRINTPTQDGAPDKPVFFIESGIHAREWIGPATTTYFINQLLTSTDPSITTLRDEFDWRIFPTVNPDGYHYSFNYERYWRKTRSVSQNGCIGADPNRNWNYNWGQYGSSNNPCDYQTYAGSKPFSEIETRSLSTYISSIENMLFYVAFHSYASLLLLPYSDSLEHVHNYDDLIKIGNYSLERGSKVNGVQYEGIGTAAETLYKASGGSMDWVRYAKNTPLMYTYELRGQSFHWPPSRIPEQGEEVTQMILGLAMEAKNLGYY